MRKAHTEYEKIELLHNAKQHLRQLLEYGAEVKISHCCYGPGPQKILGVKWIPYKLQADETVIEHGSHGLAIPSVLFEVVYTHADQTAVPRIEPWHELPAEFILNSQNMFQCVRQHDFPCAFCTSHLSQ
jgi:hypothetical protein